MVFSFLLNLNFYICSYQTKKKSIMKKFYLIMVLAFLGSTFNFSAKAQVVEEGTVLIDGYYGFPNLWTAVLKAAYAENPGAYGVGIGTFGPVGGRLEFMLSDKVGLGIDIHSATSSVSWSDSSSATNYTYKVSANRLRICPRINVHFGSSDKLDFYGAFGIGYKNTNLKFTTTDPNYVEDKASISLAPVTWRAAIGIRYFFTDNIGAGLEMGLGGVLATGGLAIKF